MELAPRYVETTGLVMIHGRRIKRGDRVAFACHGSTREEIRFEAHGEITKIEVDERDFGSENPAVYRISLHGHTEDVVKPHPYMFRPVQEKHAIGPYRHDQIEGYASGKYNHDTDA